MKHKLTKMQAIKVVEDITFRDDPYWEQLMEEYYDEETDTMPTIYDVMSALGISRDEYKKATGDSAGNWPDSEERVVIKPNKASANLIYDQMMGCYSGHMASIPNNPVLNSICRAHNIDTREEFAEFLIECGKTIKEVEQKREF